jgi:predicted enzyme related to lactoylglutathione lyase
MEGGIAYWLVTTGEEGQMGIDGAIMDRSDPAQAVINTIGVGDLEATMEAVRNAGGKADGDIDDIPTVGRFTYATDTEGNRFGILEPLPRG